ncbi:MAG TPA: T9SS type A sorting domain-containing protein [Bacteroidia bacterium]|jgi:hypothetical protein|nr:T9SS type A sorting domain-containing protein [Bacteroidia bacterium]
MKMNFKNMLSAFALLIVSSTTVFAQMNYFTLPPRKWDVTSFPGSNPTISGAASSQHIVSNGAYDEYGNLLFYIVNANIYNSSSSSVGSLLTYYADGNTFNTACNHPTLPDNKYSNIGPEIAIVPIPNACRQYYVIYTMFACTNANSVLLYMKVDCSSGAPVVTSPTASTGYLINSIGAVRGGLAVSKLLSGNASRYLFTVGANGASIDRYTINSSGIGSYSGVATTTIATNSTNPGLFSFVKVNELELSPNQQYLAWGGVDNFEKVRVLTLNSSYAVTSGTSYAFNNIKGLEFDKTNTRLYVSASAGISFINLSTTAVTVVGSSSSYNNTAIEMGSSSSGALYFVSNTGTMGRITSPSTGTPTISAGLTGTIYSNGSCTANNNDNSYRLNDQIDGENYNYFTAGFAAVDGTDFCNRTSVTASVVSYTGSVQWQTKWACPYDNNGNPTTWTNITLNGTNPTYNITSASSVGGTAFRALIYCNGYATYTNAVVVYGVGCGQTPGACPSGGGFGLLAATDEAPVSGAFAVTIYPNPSAGVFKLDAEQAVTSIEVYNTLGEVVYKNTNVDAKQTTIDISAQPKGLYFMKVANATGEVINKNITVQ